MNTPPPKSDYLSHLMDKVFERNTLAPRLPGLFEPPASLFAAEAEHAWPSPNVPHEERDSHTSEPIAPANVTDETRPSAPLVNKIRPKSGRADASPPSDNHPQAIPPQAESGTDGNDAVDSDPLTSTPRPRPSPATRREIPESPNHITRQASPPSAPPARETRVRPLDSAPTDVPIVDYGLPTAPAIEVERPSSSRRQRYSAQPAMPVQNLRHPASPAPPVGAVPARPSLIPQPIGVPPQGYADKPSEQPLPAPEPVINVTIGRVEVRATSTNQTPDSPSARRTVHPTKPLGLDDYLKRRGGGR
jgi:hypothetical protein